MKHTLKLLFAAGMLACLIAGCKKEEENTTLSVSPTTVALEVGKTATVTATVSPAGKTVTWTSDNPEVATVSGGLITAVSAGTAKVTASAGDKTATVSVTVTEPKVEVSLTIDPAEIELLINEEKTVKATVVPEGTEVVWQSLDETIATVKDGVIKGVAAGTTTVKAVAADKEATCKVTVKAPVELSIAIEEKAIVIGEQFKVEATVSPEGTTISWTSENPAVASVDNDGTVTGIAAGTTVITASAGDKTASFTVLVEAAGEGIRIDMFDEVGPSETSNGQWSSGASLSIDKTDKTQGLGSLVLTPPYENLFVLSKSFKTPINASAIPANKAVLSFDLYVEDVTKLNKEGDNQFELSSSENPDEQEVNWKDTAWELKNGWNHLELKFSAAGKTAGDINMSDIKRIRWYHIGGLGNTVVKIDNLRIIEGKEISIMLVNCDNTGWGGMAGTDSGDKTEGEACLWWMNGQGWLNGYSLPVPVNASEVSIETGVLSFDFWCETLEDLKWTDGDGEFEITSGGGPDTNELSWKVKTFGQHITKAKEWNHVDLKLSEAAKVGGNINMAAINYIRFYHVGIATMEKNIQLKIDNVRLREP